EVGVVQKIVDLSAKLQVDLLVNRELLLNGKIQLRQARAMQHVAAEIPDFPKRRNGERRRIQKVPAVRCVQERISPNIVWAAEVAEIATTGYVDYWHRHRCAIDRNRIRYI